MSWAVGYRESTSGYGATNHGQVARYQAVLTEPIQGREVWRSSIATRLTGNHSKHQKTAKSTAEAIIRGLTDDAQLARD